jgi:hypothetical protein
MDFKKLRDRAKSIVDKRGGTESLKQDAEELKDIAKGQGSLSDKAKAAAEAVKDPGSREAEAPSTPAAGAGEPEVGRAEAKVEGEERGKHAGGGRRHRRHERDEGGRGGA